MKTFFAAIGLMALCLWSVPAWSQAWIDDFNSGTLGAGWYYNAQYLLTTENNALTVDVEKTEMWKSFGVNIPAQDVTAKPVVSLKVKTETPFMLTVWLFNSTNNVNINLPVMPSDDFTTLCFDFAGMNASVLSNVAGIGLGINGAALSWKGTLIIDDLALGTPAAKVANVGGLPFMNIYQGTAGNKVLVRGISHAASLNLTGTDGLIENISFDPITSDGTAWMYFDAIADAHGASALTLTAVGEAGYSNNSVSFWLSVERNLPPTADVHPAIKSAVGIPATIQFTGITDGNPAADQPIAFTATSNNTGVIPNAFTIDYIEGSREAFLHFTPATAGTAKITLLADDQQPSDSESSFFVDVEVTENWNNAPTIDAQPDIEVLNNAGLTTIELTGISDGESGTQNLTIEAISSATGIIPNPTIEYTSGNTALLKFTPVASATGFATITLTLTDDGGTAQNNGNQSAVMQFEVETYAPPLTGYVIPFTGAEPNAIDSVNSAWKDYWHVEGMGVGQIVSHETEGADELFKIVCNGKSTWTGSWYYTPDMDLTEFPLISMWVKCDQSIKFHLYFWDDVSRNNMTPTIDFDIPANTWTKVEYDFSVPGGMNNPDGNPINAKRVVRVLFNYHPSFGWPFTDWNGTVWFKDVRIGDQSGITPTYYCTADAVGPKTYFTEAGQKSILLTGLGRGKDSNCSVSISGDGTLKNLAVSPIINGEALITFEASETGADAINVTVEGNAVSGIVPIIKEFTIPVTVTDKTTSVPTAVSINQGVTHQIYRGFGAKDPAADKLNLYTTGGFGASAIRFGILDDNQVEPLNDNADDRVINRANLNYGAFDWDYIRGLKANGVETFLVTIWSPPAWMKVNLSTNYQQAAALPWESTDNKVLTAYYDEYAEMAVIIATMFREEAGIELAGIGLQNEPAFCEPYASAILGPNQFADMIARAGQRFADAGFTTKLYAAEQVGVAMNDGPIYTNQNYLSAMNANATAKQYSDVFAVHGYASDGISPGETPGSTDWANTYAAVNANGKTRELWMTETEPPFANWNDAFTNVANILTAFESGNVALWTEWAWDGHCIDKGKPTQKYWAQSMFSYIRPGAVRMTSTSGSNDILMTTWKNDASHGNNYVAVLINKGTTPLTASLSDGSLPANFSVFRCTEQTERTAEGQYVQGDKLLLPAKSIVTLVSGLKATPTVDFVPSNVLMIDAPAQSVLLTGITDGNTSNQNAIQLTYELSNTTVIDNITLTYSSPANTATFGYSIDGAGSVDVTINVTADGVTTSRTFTIEAKNYSAPTLDAVAQPLVYNEGIGNQTLTLTGITDGDLGTQTISVSAELINSSPAGVLTDLAVNYTSPDNSAQLSFTPAVPGTCQIRVTITDNGPDGFNNTVSTLNVTVNNVDATVDALFRALQLSPVPVVDELRVTCDGVVFDSYEIRSADGRLLLMGKVEAASGIINVSTLHSGFYVISLSKSGQKLSRSFVK